MNTSKIKSIVSGIVNAILKAVSAKDAVLNASKLIRTEDEYKAIRPALVLALEKHGIDAGSIRVYCSLVRRGAGLAKVNKGNTTPRKPATKVDADKTAKAMVEKMAAKDAIAATEKQVAAQQAIASVFTLAPKDLGKAVDIMVKVLNALDATTAKEAVKTAMMKCKHGMK